MRSERHARWARAACGTACLFALLWPAAEAQAQKGADPARGAQKAAACGACHGAADRPAQPATPLLAGQNHEFLVLQMFYLREGLRDVPQMAGLLKGFSDRDLEDVAAYYARQPPAGAQPTKNAALRARGEALARARGCGSCHMEDFRGQKHVPRIAHQREDYLALALKSYRDNKRTGTDTSMNEAMNRVSDADIAALAHFLAHR
jgi:cytochrome c553